MEYRTSLTISEPYEQFQVLDGHVEPQQDSAPLYRTLGSVLANSIRIISQLAKDPFSQKNRPGFLISMRKILKPGFLFTSLDGQRLIVSPRYFDSGLNDFLDGKTLIVNVFNEDSSEPLGVGSLTLLSE